MNILAEIREGLGISWWALRANKMRSILTTLGIVIGILTVSLMATAIEGLNRAFLRSISALGSDVFYIEKFPWESHEKWWKIKNRRDFQISDARIIASQSKQVLAVSIESSGDWPVSSKDKTVSSVWVVGNNEQSAL